MPDLIDREELIMDMKDTKENVMRMFQFPKNQINVAEAVADAMLYNARHAPAVDVVPVVHGHWISEADKYSLVNHLYHPYICSECNTVYWVYQPNGELIGMDFCPHCGAKMDDGRERDEN